MDFRLPEELVAFKDSLRRFIEKEVLPHEARVQRDGLDRGLARELSEKTRAAGWWFLDLPESAGGQGLSLLGMTVFWEEVSRTVAIPARDTDIFGPVVGPIVGGLQGAQAERYLQPVMRGEKRVCFAQTEPDAGADPAGMRTRAVRKDGYYLLNGRKRFITAADRADFATVFAVTDPAGGMERPVSCLLVDMTMPGVRIARLQETMMGERPCEIEFENVEVPAENLVGVEGGGFRLAQKWINHGRIRHGARACGVAERCIELAASYAKQRKTFGAPLADRQAVQWMLADSYTDVHATRLMVQNAAWRADQGEDVRAESYMVKLFGDEMGFRAADRCMQIHGGIGLTLDLPIERFWRDQRSFLITEGPSEVMRMAIARHVLRQYG